MNKMLKENFMLHLLLLRSCIHRTLEKFRETEAEHRHKKDAAVLQLEEKQTLLQLEVREANRKVKEGEEHIEQLEAQLVTVAKNQQRQDEESAGELKKEIQSLQEQLDKERKKKNKQSEANQSLKQVSTYSEIYYYYNRNLYSLCMGVPKV